MRKRRAILYEDDRAILTGLTEFFEDLGYEVIAFEEPVICPVYGEGAHSDKERPCGDIMITDLLMPRMSGLELIKLQAARGCKLTIRNKAIHSGSLEPATLAVIRSLGCAAFLKPCRLSTLAAWVRECEQRMDLSRPLGLQRKEPRETCRSGAVFSAEHAADLYVAEVVNKSGSGLCVRVDKPLAEAQILNLQTRLPLSSDRLQVRWTRPLDGGFLAGMSCC
jgi:DNA-binding response OmpR family regulator